MNAVIFDFNGTLFNDGAKHVLAWGRMGEKLRGKPVTQQELDTELNGKTNAAILEIISGETDPSRIQALSEEKEAVYRQLLREDPDFVHLTPGAEELFDWLKENQIPFTIASASIKSNIDFFVDTFHLDRWIDPNMIVYDDGRFASKKEMLEEASRKLNVPLDQCTVFEDSLAGVACTIEAGVPDIRVVDTSGTYDKVKDAWQVRQKITDMRQASHAFCPEREEVR